MPRDNEPVPAELNLRCAHCGYTLTGLVERRCPECGEVFEPRETWLDNERSTWEYHFENVRSRADYARLGYLVVTALFFFSLVCADIKTILALPLVVFAEMYIVWTAGPGTLIRMDCWTVCVVWGVIVALLSW